MASVAKRKWTKPDGSTGEAWTVRYKDSGGRYRQRTFERKKDADQFRGQAVTELAKGTHIAAGATVTVASLWDEFAKRLSARVFDGRIGRASERNISDAARCQILPRFGARLVPSITADEVEDWYGDLCRGTAGRRRLAPRTARARVVTLKAMLDHAVSRRYANGNVATEALIRLRGIANPSIDTLTLDQARHLLRAAGERPHNGEHRAFALLPCAVHLAAFCGLRYGEIMGLTLADVDIDAGLIHVRHSLTRDGTLKGPKTRAGIRDVPLPSHLATLIAQWVARYYIPNPDQLVFRSRTGGRITGPSFHAAYWKKLLARAGLNPALHFHALRHFAASWMVDNGWSLPDVASIMGHARFDMTLQTYTHAISLGSRNQVRMQELADRLDCGPLALPAPENGAPLHMSA